ncbi:MAG TPA: S41 family peptidase [Gemmatimonadales bacterium]|nr:S41 family peptidase [Gemmatimonadales bacterium]
MPRPSLLCFSLCCTLAGGAATGAAQQLTETDRAQAVAVVWASAKYNYAGWDRVRADWDSALAANLTLSRAPQSDAVFWRRLQQMVALLEDGQAEVTPSPWLGARIGRPPILLRAVEHRPLIMDYAENNEMRVARPERLAEVVAVQGVPAERWIRDSILPAVSASTPEARWARAVDRMLEGDRGTALHLQIRLGSGEERGASVTRSVSVLEPWPLEPPSVEVDTLEAGVVWVRINSFADPDVVDRFDHDLPDFSRVQGLIVDLRDNAGGTLDAGYRILARLSGKPFVTLAWRTPQYRPAYQAADMPDSAGSWLGGPADTIAPRTDRPVFTGPLVVLSSPRTAGAAVEFLATFRNARRGPIVGEASAGEVGVVRTFALPKGWSFRVSVTREAFPDGTEFAATGIPPEMPVTVLLRDVLAGKDAGLDRARAYLATVHLPN